MSYFIILMMLNEFEFNKVIGDIRFTWAKCDFKGALAIINGVIDHVTPEMKAHCLLLSGNIKDDQGLSSDARRDWMSAIPVSRTGSFDRHCLECAIGRSYENASLRDEALDFYRSAIQTCAIGDDFAGNKALNAFLALHNGRIPPEDKVAVTAAVDKSWKILELSGEPDLIDLSNAITELEKGLQDKIRRIKEG